MQDWLDTDHSETLPLAADVFEARVVEYAALPAKRAKYPGQIGIGSNNKIKWFRFAVASTFADPDSMKNTTGT